MMADTTFVFHLTIIFVVAATTRGSIVGLSPASGSCLCVNSDEVTVLSSACGDVIDVVNKGQCYIYSGVSAEWCSSHQYFNVGDGWIDDNYLNLSSSSACSATSGTDPVIAVPEKESGALKWLGSSTSENAEITSKCLNCICQVESQCNPNIGCHWDVTSDSCGPYQIKMPYWVDCGKPGGDWKTCANNMNCASNCVRAYMRLYATKCTGGATPTCQDFARIHNGGPRGCRSSATIGYWNKVKTCCGSQTGCD